MNKQVATRVFTKVKKEILAEPRSYVQWDPNRCLIARAEQMLGVNAFAQTDAEVTAALRKMGLRNEDEMHDLFFFGRWPRSIQKRYFAARTHQERAQVAADRIDHFLATGK